jgi:hypothetical protein
MRGDPEAENIFICWAQLSKFNQDGDRIHSPNRCVLSKMQDDG